MISMKNKNLFLIYNNPSIAKYFIINFHNIESFSGKLSYHQTIISLYHLSFVIQS